MRCCRYNTFREDPYPVLGTIYHVSQNTRTRFLPFLYLHCCYFKLFLYQIPARVVSVAVFERPRGRGLHLHRLRGMREREGRETSEA